jgi:hypothetical protein
MAVPYAIGINIELRHVSSFGLLRRNVEADVHTPLVDFDGDAAERQDARDVIDKTND